MCGLGDGQSAVENWNFIGTGRIFGAGISNLMVDLRLMCMRHREVMSPLTDVTMRVVQNIED